MIQGALDADGRIAAKNAVKIRAALHQVTDFKRVFQKYQETQPQATDNPTQDRARARAWVILNVYLNDEPLDAAIKRSWAEAYVLGQAAAGEWIAKTKEMQKADQSGIDWDNWQPGDQATALLLKPTGGFAKFLEQSGGATFFKKFDKETIENLGTALSDSIAAGLDAERAAVMIGKHVASPSRALTIAITEQNRAMSFGSIQRYKEAELERMEWHVSDPCDKCAQNSGQVVVIGQSFNSGQTQPPAHPHCRCVLLPVIPGMEEGAPIPGATVIPTPPVSAFPTPKEQAEQAIAALHTVKPVLDSTPEMLYKQLDMRGYEPGNWEIVPREVMREVAIQNAMRSVRNMNRAGIESFFTPNRISKADKALIEKGLVYKNGKVEVQFASAGLKVTEAQRQLLLKKVDELQTLNPKDRAVVHIDKNSSTKYGWAYGGKSDLWVTPKVVQEPDYGMTERGGFKMPVTDATTQLEYTLTHEWGHLIDDINDGAQSLQRQVAIGKIQDAFPDEFKSRYSAKNDKEFFAEMFTEYINTNGETPNKLVQAMAKEFGWKANRPLKPVIKPTYIAAKHDANYYLADVEATEERLKSMIPTIVREKDGARISDWTAASGGSGPENIQLKNLMREQGFLGRPRVVDETEFKKIVNQGATPIYRGMGAETKDQVDEYVGRLLNSDDPFIGRGFFGDGTYFASDKGIAERFAAQNASGEINFKFGEVLEGVLDPQAKVIDIEDLWKLRDKYVEGMPYHGELAQAYEDDIGLFATTQGYDAIVNKNPMIGYDADGQRRYAPGAYYTVLNRSALIMKGTP